MILTSSRWIELRGDRDRDRGDRDRGTVAGRMARVKRKSRLLKTHNTGPKSCFVCNGKAVQVFHHNSNI